MTKLNKCIPIVVFFLFITVGISKAEPTPTVSYLMNTPVSMLDFGIYKLERYLNKPAAFTEIYNRNNKKDKSLENWKGYRWKAKWHR